MTADCEIIVVLDRSGSMASVRTAMEDGFNAFIDEQTKQPGTCNVTLVQFDEGLNGVVSLDESYVSRPISQIPPLSLVPRGGTPLRDALGAILVKAEQRLLGLPRTGTPLDYTAPPKAVLVLVITDGEDTCSKEFTQEGVKALVERITTEHGWVFSYMGANVDAFKEASDLGVVQAQSLNFAATGQGVRNMYAAVSLATSALRGGGAYDLSVPPINPEDEEAP